jgi:hypothetical protein
MIETLQTKGKEIKGLIDAGIFSYLLVTDIPSDRQHKLLNANATPAAHSWNTNVEFVQMGVNNATILITGTPTLQYFSGAPSDLL